MVEKTVHVAPPADHSGTKMDVGIIYDNNNF